MKNYLGWIILNSFSLGCWFILILMTLAGIFQFSYSLYCSILNLFALIGFIYQNKKDAQVLEGEK